MEKSKVSPSNLTDVWYENIQPFLVSHVNKDKNSAKLYGFGDGWTYEKINVKLGYRGDTFPLHNAWISDIQSPFWKYVTNTGRVQYIVPIYLNNLENFQVCFQDYVFTIPDDIYRSQYSDLIKERVTNYSVFICDQTLNATQIVWQRCGPWIHSSTNSLNFSNVLNYEFLNSPQIALKTNSECVDANSTRDNSYLVFEPLIQ
ncbi:MAG: hypothetical protein HYS80_02465 [Candidatus Aenigmarchaeota archaeon]|nr:hypothetical protein [Candidatus Aenigmarchaeota archaeon]